MKIAFCFDLDGTLTEEEILPQIAKKIGIFEEIEILTKITMNGLMTFDKSFKLRVKLLSTVAINEVESVVRDIKINHQLKNFINENNSDSYIVTGNLDTWVHKFIKENYNCSYFSSSGISEGNQLIELKDILHKSDAIDKLRKQYDIIIAIGDGMNDCSMFEKADIGIAYGGVHSPVQTLISLSDYVIYDSSTLVNFLNSLKNFYREN